MRRFTSIGVDYGDDETRNFGPRTEFSALTSLYEVHTVATISEEGNDENDYRGDLDAAAEDNEKLPSMRCTSTEEFVAVVVGLDLSVFSLQYGATHVLTLCLTGIEKVVALCFLPGTDILAAVSNDAKLFFVSVTYKGVVCKLDLCDKGHLDETSMSAVCSLGDYYISIASGTKCFTVCLSDFESSLAVYLEPKGAQELLQKLRKTPVSTVDCPFSISDVSILPGMEANLVVPLDASGSMALVVGNSVANGCSLLSSKETCGFVRIRECCNSRFLLMLAADGRLVIVDALTCLLLFEKQLLPESEKPIDFAVIEGGRAELSISTKIALLVMKGDKAEFQVRSLDTAQVLYSVAISPNSLLLNVAAKDDGCIFFTEFVESGADGANVRLRSVSECQPQMRLQRLLNRCEFDEAENFARLFNLDLQQVYKSRANYLLTFLDSEEQKQEYFNTFTQCLDKVQDENWVGETCSASATLCRSFDWIVSLLRYAETKNITDSDTLEGLARLRYNLASYRMLFGPEKAPFGRDSLWSDFVSDDNWHTLFLNFCEAGYATEAGLLWQRYSNVLKDWMQTQEHAFSSFIAALRNFIANDRSPNDLLELAEHEVLPTALISKPVSTTDEFVEWLFSLGNRLESLERESFPENALHVCSIMERITQSMLTNAITPMQQAQLAHTLAVIRVDSEDETNSMGRLNIFVKNLREMDKLKKKYECCFSYSFYTEQTVESICRLILERARNVGLVKQNITQFAIPYMEEHKLDVDQTLFSHILDVARLSAGVVTGVNPWDERCLAIAGTIGCHGLRCKAVIGIAKRAHPPWTLQLRRAVDFMLNDANVDVLLKLELEKQCHLAHLGQIVMRYAVSFLRLEDLILRSRYAQTLIGFVLRQAQVEPDLERRICDTLKMVDLIERLKPNLITREECYLQCCMLIIEQVQPDDMFSLLIRCIGCLAESDRLSLVRRIVQMAISATDCCVPTLTEKEKEQRIKKINAALCVLQRFSLQTVDDLDLAEKFRAIKKLQEEFGVFVGCRVLDSDSEKKELLEAYIRSRGSDKNISLSGNDKNISKVLRFASALTIDIAKACEIAAKIAVDAQEPLPAVAFVLMGLRNITEKNGDLIEVSVRSCKFALWKMHELAEQNNLEPLFILVEAVGKCVPLLVDATMSQVNVLATALTFSTFMEIFARVIAQCMIGDGEQSGAAHPNVSATLPSNSEKGEVFGMNRRLGIYQSQSDGAIFDKSGAVRAMALVARSVLEEGSDKERDVTNWGALCDFLSVSNQPYLELCCRVFSTHLAYARDRVLFQYEQLRPSIRALCERALLQYPCDLCLVSAALFSVAPAAAKKTLLELRNWAKGRRTPQVMLSLIRVSRFVCLRLGDRSAIEQMTQYYAVSIWTRRMMNLGGTMPSVFSTKPVVHEFVKARIPVNNLLDFCADFRLDKSEAVTQYALQMAVLCSVEKDPKVADEMFGLSSHAFKLLTVTEDIFLRLYDCLMLLCPYNYSVIELLVTEMQKRAKEDDDVHVTLMRRLINLFSFLVTTERFNLATESEVRWYQERQKCLEKKNFAGNALYSSMHSESLLLNNSSIGQSGDAEQFMEGIYERPNILLAKLPSFSRFRFPFHTFLFEDEKDIKNILLPIINAELTLFNVNSWQRMARSMPHLSISRSRLLSSAVMIVIKGHINNGTTIEDEEVELIEELLFKASNQAGIAEALSQGFRNVPLGETKLRLLEIGVRVSKRWLQSSDLQYPLSEETRKVINSWLRMLVPALRTFRTEFVLQKGGLVKEETLNKLQSPDQLITYIYSYEINWADIKDKEDKLALIDKIAAIYEMDLTAVQSRLLDEWLQASGSQTANLDLNETDGDAVMTSQDEDLVYKLPYLNDSLTRLIHLLRLRDRRQAALTLSTEFTKDLSMSSYSTKVRSLCCLLRLFSSEELESFVQQSARSLCSSMELLLYGRLIEVCGIELPLKTFTEKKKDALVRSLLSNNYRQTVQLAYLASCMVVDYQLDDRAVVEMLLARLHAVGRREMLTELLRFCAANPQLSCVRNLAQLWARVADWMAADIDLDAPSARILMRSFLHFSLSCPVEGGRAFGGLCTTVDAQRLPVASQLIRVAVSATASCAEQKENLKTKSELDLHFEWLNETAVEQKAVEPMD